jgi:poly(hydroxyalkanoate) depolymerase family esterase
VQHSFSKLMSQATRLTKSGSLAEATAAIQRALGRAVPPPSPLAATPAPQILRDLFCRPIHPEPPTPGAPEAGNARFLTASFTNAAGARPYKLYIPATYRGQPVPLIVMLHGCTQSPDDFAAGTRMNLLADQHNFLVAYPAQISAANPQRCWNWFNEQHQQRDTGEPSLIAGITHAIMQNYAVDKRRVYIAGLSAGGAAAAIMGATHPDLYAAIGVHSGLPYGAARDLPSALVAMKRGATGTKHAEPHQGIVPLIIFHGDRDHTVNPRNAHALAAQAASQAPLRTHTEQGQISNGHAYTRSLHTGANGQTLIENWTIHGAPHAWSGGSPAGTYTDPAGPSASSEMLRFFQEHPHSGAR